MCSHKWRPGVMDVCSNNTRIMILRLPQISIRSLSAAPAGIRPSLSSLSNRVISCIVLASLIIFSTLFFSVSVSLTRIDFSGAALPSRWADTSKVRDLIPIIFEANCVGSDSLPNSSFAFCRSASFTLWKSRNRMVGMRQISQYR